ncbi:MAG: hypothetical protein U0414_17440 [Polyangiaceae bacterium]
MGPTKLLSLGDAPVPPTLADDLAAIAGLPPTAVQAFWEALGPSLKEPLPPEIEGTLDKFSRDHGAPPGDLARAIRGARFLVREAVRRGLGAAALESDLKALLPDREPVVRLLLAGSAKARAVLTEAALGKALLDHGNVADSIAWRADDVSSSHRGEILGARVAVVTMRLRTPAGTEELVTFQLTQQHAKTLKELAIALERPGQS